MLTAIIHFIAQEYTGDDRRGKPTAPNMEIGYPRGGGPKTRIFSMVQPSGIKWWLGVSTRGRCRWRSSSAGESAHGFIDDPPAVDALWVAGDDPLEVAVNYWIRFFDVPDALDGAPVVFTVAVPRPSRVAR